ncbi:hypothetical protein [Streptomyces nanshensis]|uniref:Uncharacterized protein n=1 Tax=Streptomyces nanshensis TaxID=518642 RepID=A0A1E7LAQ3_9ACTN|nr:hypothetical protein [Streptomyces nanshensis]OEV13228.1 hypothetical protein AN218_04580 [Streptomyces nanshensis]
MTQPWWDPCRQHIYKPGTYGLYMCIRTASGDNLEARGNIQVDGHPTYEELAEGLVRRFVRDFEVGEEYQVRALLVFDRD